MRYFILLTVGLLAFSSCKKKGCTDESAINYSSEAKEDDGSCQFPPAAKTGELELKVFSFMNNKVFAYNTPFMLPDSSYISFTLCRMYVANPFFTHFSDSTKHVDKSGDVILIDPEIPTYKLGTFAEGTYSGWRFNFGIDSLTNNPKQPTDFEVGAPLGPQNPSMHWGWQQKYIYVKIEGLYDSDSNDVPDEVVQYHMGADKYAQWVEKYQAQQIMVKSGGSNETKINIDWAEFLKGQDIGAQPKSHMTDTVSDAIMGRWANVFK
jgi:hypothetical protein